MFIVASIISAILILALLIVLTYMVCFGVGAAAIFIIVLAIISAVFTFAMAIVDCFRMKRTSDKINKKEDETTE